jgi:hypothetical protein
VFFDCRERLILELFLALRSATVHNGRKFFPMQSLIALILVGTVSVALADGEAIGFAVATGSFQLDNAQVYGNTTLFDGATISTATAPSRLELTNGARMTLGEDSQARVFENRMTLDRGTGELKAPASYRMDARTLQISPLDAKSIARVKLEGSTQVLVAAINGRVRVLNEAGVLVANVEPGRTFLFTAGVGVSLADSSAPRCCGPNPVRPDPPTGAIPRVGGSSRTGSGRPNSPTGIIRRAGGSPPSMPSMSP